MDNKNLSKLTAWPFIEAKRILKQLNKESKVFLNLETGYGPSGVPHIGTFAEVLRTNMVKNAFSQISQIATKLITFSDDLDALKKVPEDYTHPEKLKAYINYPLSSIPDFTGKFASYADKNNYLLKSFLDEYGFDYQFISSTQQYKKGTFDKFLMRVLENYEQINEVVLPTLRRERRESYSPFLPISNVSGKVLQVPIKIISKEQGIIAYKNEKNVLVETLITKGSCKLQWKVDWAMRWSALDIGYEMNGKDLIPSFELSKRIAKLIYGKVPVNMSYELFLDDKGEKISKSKGNGLSIEEWIRYGTKDSLSIFMYQNPKRAKRLYFDCIPRSMDEYKKYFDSIKFESSYKVLDNPVWHVHEGILPEKSYPIDFTNLLNLVTALNTNDIKTILSFVKLYIKKELDVAIENKLLEIIKLAICYFEDFILPNLKKRKPNEKEKQLISKLIINIKKSPNNMEAEDYQKIIYKFGKEFYPDDLRSWFVSLYQILFGSKNGPRLGSLFFIFGKERTIRLLEDSIS